MTIRAEIVADSINTATGDRLTTFIWTYPRMVHAEALRHRALSRNAASSRAIPVRRMLENILRDPARPVEWGTAQKGMQAGPPLDGEQAEKANAWWTDAAVNAVEDAQDFHDELGLHKQVVNRLVEPFAHMTELVSGTEWGNFFRLRIHSAADPTLCALATAAGRAYLASEPIPVDPGGWHIPFGDRMPEGLSIADRLKIATARAARLSYETHNGDFSPEADMQKHDDLKRDGHWSPFEHCARATGGGRLWRPSSGNFRGWHQYREAVDGGQSREPITRDELVAILAEHGSPYV